MTNAHTPESLYDMLVQTLYSFQTQEGLFPSETMGSKSGELTTRSTTFYTALILLSLRSSPHQKLSSLIKRSVSFLGKEMSSSSTWNYWATNTKERKQLPYPDDLDCTFCALSALSFHVPTTITGSLLAQVTALLIENEVREGGPYYTWSVPKKLRRTWSDVDPVVNANILLFLEQEKIVLPNVTSFIQNACRENKTNSLYYDNLLVFYYFVSRLGIEKPTQHIIHNIYSLKKKRGVWENPLLTALAVITLLHLGVSPKKLHKEINWMISFAQKNTWESYPFFIEAKTTETLYSGSKGFLVAVYIEAFSLYEEKLKAEKHKVDSRGQKLHNAIKQSVLKRMSHLPEPSKRKVAAYVEKLTIKDPLHQITLLPYQTARSFTQPQESTLLCKEAGVANLHGWLAYRIYDDLLDDEGNPEDIPIANTSLREVVRLYEKHLPENDHIFLLKVLDDIESANAWEVTRCKKGTFEQAVKTTDMPNYGTYDVLYKKSFGHALAPLSVFIASGYSRKAPETKAMLSFFKHYIIARQLNDDAHDWLTDLERGFLNSVSVNVLTEVPIRSRNNKTRLQKTFWNTTILTVAEDIRIHVQKARKNLTKINNIVNTEYFESLLTPIELGAQQALTERTRMQEFLRIYK